MSLIERAIDKLGATPPAAPARVEPAAPAAGATLERAAPRTPPRAPEPPAPQAPPLQLDLDALRERGFATPDGANAAASGEFRVIKRPLIANAFGPDASGRPNARRVMVTSSLPGEGKSHCAINLALSIAAERDHQVLLVDADVAKPSIARHLGVQMGAGLMDWLLDGGPDLGALVRPTSVDRLSILPAGRRDEQATELLASAAMGRLLEALAERYPDRIVVFDSPPLMVTTEARVLASYMGQVVMVVEAGRTPRVVVDEALGMLPREQVVGLVLNKSRRGAAGGYYGSYYGYGDAAYGASRD
jgi:protein-tyrosine kinase